jgi:hypothetical protein
MNSKKSKGPSTVPCGTPDSTSAVVDLWDTQILQNDLNSMEEWENRWQMAFHPEKCVVIRVSNKRKPINARNTIHGHVLEQAYSKVGLTSP